MSDYDDYDEIGPTIEHLKQLSEVRQRQTEELQQRLDVFPQQRAKPARRPLPLFVVTLEVDGRDGSSYRQRAGSPWLALMYVPLDHGKLGEVDKMTVRVEREE